MFQKLKWAASQIADDGDEQDDPEHTESDEGDGEDVEELLDYPNPASTQQDDEFGFDILGGTNSE
jgi:hypothetical protein